MASFLHKWLLLLGLSIAVSSFNLPPVHGKLPGNKAFHPFYISVTEISHNSKDKTLEVSCKMFADDFEQSLENNYKTVLDITDTKNKAALDKLIADYITKHLAIAADSKIAKLQYIGFEKEKESVYCYFQADNIASVKKLDIYNNILQDFTNDQINIIHVTVNGKRQSTKLDFPKKQAAFLF